MESEQIIFIAGFFNMFCAASHIFFPRLFQWNRIVSPLVEDDKRAVLINLHIMNGCILVFLLIFGLISLFNADDIVSTSLGKTLMACLAVFWIIRSMVQALIIYGVIKLKRPRNIVMSATVPLLFFIAGIILYLVPLVRVM